MAETVGPTLKVPCLRGRNLPEEQQAPTPMRMPGVSWSAGDAYKLKVVVVLDSTSC